jgi:Domain of unknown function (DUF4832)/Domain of unknown function (DUF4874)
MKRYPFYFGAIACIAVVLVAYAKNQQPNPISSSLTDINSDDRPSGETTQPEQQLAIDSTSSAQQSTTKRIVTYKQTTADFLNPERGFHNDIDLIGGRDFRYVREKGHTLSRVYIRLEKYRNQPLPAEFLNQLNQQFQLVRSAGIKVFPRFVYNFPGPNESMAEIAKSPDASLNLTLSHINQLKPILQNNADVIAALQGGFIGAWGEWHSSGSGLAEPEPKAKILSALLTALPPNRMVQVRYANDIKASYPQALTKANAFRGSRQARVAFHNDCFLTNQSDSGTFEPKIPEMRNYISQIAPFIPVGGETCAQTPAEQRIDCPSAEADLAKFHWSYLTIDLYEPARDRWKSEGCYDKISRSLGYRLQLVRSDFPLQVKRDRQFGGKFVIKNIGYASPFNPRGLELILRHQQTGKVYRLPVLKPLSKTNDPRFWLPQVGEVAVDVRGKIPKAAPLGGYDLLLNLPDPMPKLANRPEYSIRLANDQTWEAKTGFNSLRRTIQLAK